MIPWESSENKISFIFLALSEIDYFSIQFEENFLYFFDRIDRINDLDLNDENKIYFQQTFSEFCFSFPILEMSLINDDTSIDHIYITLEKNKTMNVNSKSLLIIYVNNKEFVFFPIEVDYVEWWIISTEITNSNKQNK